MSENHVAQDILRLTPAERETLLAALNAHINREEEMKLRTADRYPYVVADGLTVEFRQQGQVKGTFLVAPRNISVGGVAFLHGSFVYPGTDCTIALKTRDGKLIETRGQVARCRTIQGRIHEIGVGFKKPVKLDEFVDTSTPLILPDSPEYSTVDVAGLARRLQELAFRAAPLAEVRQAVFQLIRTVGRRTRRPELPDNEPLPVAEELQHQPMSPRKTWRPSAPRS